MRRETVKRAQSYRGDPTSAEAKLWSLLRSRRLDGRKFRRQHTIGPYVVDFACPAIKLVVEADGPHHDQVEQAAFDASRTIYLEQNGWRVLRFKNDEVLQSLGSVEARLFETLSG